MREVLNLNFKWAFQKQGGVPEKMPELWNIVNLPHTWNDIDGQDGGNDLYRGKASYAKLIYSSDIPKADKYYLEVNGANSSADVYLNGKHLAHHDGGYSTWRVDVSGLLENENLLVFELDNAPNDYCYPQSADFTFYGGLYRDVNLICVSDTHFDLETYGGPGIKVTPLFKDDKWIVNVETPVINPKDGQKLVTKILKPCGCLLQEKECDIKDGKVEFVIDKPHLWDGLEDPYLYTAAASVVKDGEIVDEVKARFGLRTFEIDPERGFILNGREYPLHGVSRHQDRWGLGNALTKKEHKQDIELILEGGFNTIRLAHYQHDQYFYDLCDESGLVIWAEIPYITTHLPTARENTISQMKELVSQNYNHASIFVWGLSNEINNGSYPKDVDEDLIENHHILNDICHEMDPTRLTTMAIVSGCPIDHPYVQIPDTVSWNHYFGWYGGEVGEYGPWMDNFHNKYPNLAVGMSEYGCEAPLNWHSSTPSAGDYSEEYQAYYHEECIKQFFTRKYIWATHVWNMFDFGADARNEGGENGQNHKGLIDFKREYKKDSFYAYKAWLSKKPFVHIAGKRYIDRVEDVTKVTVYSNLEEVELFANGVSLGKKKADDHFFKFDVKNVGSTTLKAVAGDLEDTAVINKVAEPNKTYVMQEKGAVLNWWDITEVEGKFSLNSKLSEFGKVEGAAAKLEEIIAKVTKKEGSSMSYLVKAIGNFTVIRALGLMSMVLGNLSKEELLTINAELNKLDK